MASTSSFDISTGADLQEVDNAVNQTIKEIEQRYDFKGTHCTVEFDRTKAEIKLHADDEFDLHDHARVLHKSLTSPLLYNDRSRYECRRVSNRLQS